MKLDNVIALIELHEKSLIQGEHLNGYRVHFTQRVRAGQAGDYFPERTETPFTTVDEAWRWAVKFEAATRSDAANVGDIYLIDAQNFLRIEGQPTLRPWNDSAPAASPNTYKPKV